MDPSLADRYADAAVGLGCLHFGTCPARRFPALRRELRASGTHHVAALAAGARGRPPHWQVWASRPRRGWRPMGGPHLRPYLRRRLAGRGPAEVAMSASVGLAAIELCVAG